MVAKDYHKTKRSTKAEVGEIDTTSPFQSVKHAVSLFGEDAFSGKRPAPRKAKSQSAERVLAKEMQLHLAQKKLNKLKVQLQNAETTKVQALVELNRAQRTVEDLTWKLECVTNSKDSATVVTEMAKHQMKLFSEFNGSAFNDLETARIEYMDAATEFNVAKQELWKIHEELDALVKAKDAAASKAAEAENASRSNMERFGELSKEIASVEKLAQQVKLASVQANEEETIIRADKNKTKQLYDIRLDELSKRSIALKKNIDPELINTLDTKLHKRLSEVEALGNKIESTKTDNLLTVTSELNGAKESLCEAAEEENSLRNLVESLKVELSNLKKEHSEMKEKEVETESVTGNLHVILRKAKSDLEEAVTEEAKARGASDEMIETIHELELECENTKHEAAKMKQQADELKREAEAAGIELEEAEKRLSNMLCEAEEAKAAEIRALDQLRKLPMQNDAEHSSTSELKAQITVSRDEYESLSQKAKAFQKLAEMRVEAAMAQLEAVKASEDETIKKLKASHKEIEELKASKEEVLRKAEMAEAARKTVEGELRRRHECELKKAAEAASQVVAETEKAFELSPLNTAEKQNFQETEITKRSVSKKVMMPSLCSGFSKKKNQVGRSSHF